MNASFLNTRRSRDFFATSIAYAATITVNSDVDGLVDPGDATKCTLRAAVDAINTENDTSPCGAAKTGNYNDDDTILFDSSVFASATTIEVANGGHIEIAKDLTIIGPVDASDTPLITLDAEPLNGTANNRILEAINGGKLTVRGLAFKHGMASPTGGAGVTPYGAAIRADENIVGDSHELVIENCTFNGDRAYTSDGGAVYGVIVDITGSIFEDNLVTGYSGGAVFAKKKLTVTKTIFNRNKGYTMGGAIAGDGPIDITDCEFTDNEALHGGAIGVTFPLSVVDSKFTNNSATAASGRGGAIYATEYIWVSGSTFTENNAVGGGAISHTADAHIYNSTFVGNKADCNNCQGGAINSQGFINISGSTFIQNRADYGGAVMPYNYNNPTAMDAKISNSTFSENQANMDGGAIWASGRLTVNHVTLVGNTAGRTSAAIQIDGSNSRGEIHNSLILSGSALIGVQSLCTETDNATLTGSYNIEWVNGTDTTSCGDSTTSSWVPASVSALNEIVLPLDDNGGPTETFAVPDGSPAVGAADPGDTSPGGTGTSKMLDFPNDPSEWVDATLDQRGEPRAASVAEGRYIGAYEVLRAPPPPSGPAAPIPLLPFPLVLGLALMIALGGAVRLHFSGKR